MHRRHFVLSALALRHAFHRLARIESPFGTAAMDEFAAIERRVKGRLGVAVLDTASGRRLGYHADSRFPMCSTFKWLLVARILTRVENREEDLARLIKYSEADILAYAPITKQHLQEGRMSVSALAEAAVEYSDNTAANLLLATIGGPAGLTSWLRSIGDQVTRLDRNEPELNSATPGDKRDTTSPNAVVADLNTILLGKVLAESSRDLLIGWLKANTTGGARIRAGLPAGWTVGDKTGTGANGSTNDVAIVWPPGGKPVLIAAYLTGTRAKSDNCNSALADVGRIVAKTVTGDR